MKLTSKCAAQSIFVTPSSDRKNVYLHKKEWQVRWCLMAVEGMWIHSKCGCSINLVEDIHCENGRRGDVCSQQQKKKKKKKRISLEWWVRWCLMTVEGTWMHSKCDCLTGLVEDTHSENGRRGDVCSQKKRISLEWRVRWCVMTVEETWIHSQCNYLTASLFANPGRKSLQPNWECLWHTIQIWQAPLFNTSDRERISNVIYLVDNKGSPTDRSTWMAKWFRHLPWVQEAMVQVQAKSFQRQTLVLQ